MARDALQKTPLHALHRARSARLVEFGGWEMPVSYRGILEEHRTVREAAGLFDVSHMGEIELTGPRAAAACQALTTNDVARLVDGQVQYTLLCNQAGGVVDDVTLYRRGPERYFFCVNAGNIDKDRAWIEIHAAGATVIDRSAETALLALQGPRAETILGRLTTVPLAGLRAFRCVEGVVADLPVLISRTGYTGEDGFEVYLGAAAAPCLWEALLEAGAADGLEPIGLGARDTLRLEAALPLYGHELDEATTPLAAGLDRFVKLDGDEFVGRAALRRERAEGSPRRLVGLEVRGAGIARQGYPVLADGRAIGRVTSGTHAPTLGRAIALAYVGAAFRAPGTRLAVEIRGTGVEVTIVPLPFYRRRRPPRAAAGVEKGDS